MAMNPAVTLSNTDGVALIRIDNPPVNALNQDVIDGISAAVDAVARDGSVRAVVLIGAGRTFIAGADIKEFAAMTSGRARREVGLNPVLGAIEGCARPVVAVHPGVGNEMRQWPAEHFAALIDLLVEKNAVNAVLIKVNQAGTVTEAHEALLAARLAGMGTIVSARSGETEDLTIVHLAVGWNAGQFKVGSFSRSERMAKWNEMIRIEQALGTEARFSGSSWLPGRGARRR